MLLQDPQPTPADCNRQKVDGLHTSTAPQCSHFDYINDRLENVSNSVDKKGEEYDGCILPSASVAAAASKIQENVSTATSITSNDAAVGGVFYARKVASSGDEDDEFVNREGGEGVIRVCQLLTCHRQVGSSDGYISSRQRLQKCHQEQQKNLQQKLQRCQQSRPVTAAKECSMEVNFENISLQPHQKFEGCAVELNGAPSDVLAKFRRQCNESVAKNFDHRIRYGLSSLEIYSKYSSRRSDIGGRSENGFWSGSDEKYTSGASTAATFFARYLLTFNL